MGLYNFQARFVPKILSGDYPGCLLDSFHEGEHQFASSEEKHARILGSANHYGTNTRSYNRSAEKREMDRQRKEATARYLAEREKQTGAPVSTLEKANVKIAAAEIAGADSVSLTRGEWTALWMADPRNRGEFEVPISCTCLQRPYPHELSVHKAVKFESRANRWPWSLRYAPEMEVGHG